MCKDTQILGEEEHLVQNQLQESKTENPFQKMAFGVEEKLVKIKTKGGILVLNQCGHCQFRFEIGFTSSAEDERDAFFPSFSLKTWNLMPAAVLITWG